ncbi:hypothetical protein HC891_24940 [Candidatus Gracilibacteria bacterium]|nr:hypothetical protein [Candidatus Gracilibacteria bacterium]
MRFDLGVGGPLRRGLGGSPCGAGKRRRIIAHPETVVAAPQRHIELCAAIVQGSGELFERGEIARLSSAFAEEIVDLLARKEHGVALGKLAFGGQFKHARKMRQCLDVGIAVGGTDSGQVGVVSLARRIFGLPVVARQYRVEAAALLVGVLDLVPGGDRPMQVTALGKEQRLVGCLVHKPVTEAVAQLRLRLLQVGDVLRGEGAQRPAHTRAVGNGELLVGETHLAIAEGRPDHCRDPCSQLHIRR